MKWTVANLTIARPVATIMLTLMVVVLGVSAMVDIPRDLMPDIELPVAIVMTSYPNASPEEVETMVTRPVEQALASVENLNEMMSYSMEGSSVIVLMFHLDSDMNFATLNMREKIAFISGYLPSQASDPMVMKLDMNMMPVMQVYVSADLPLKELTSRVENQVTPFFERSSGVASVSSFGGVTEEIAIEFNQETLLGYGLNLSLVSQILAAENINLPSGDVAKGVSKVIVRTLGELHSVAELEQIPLVVADRSILRLGDVATVTQTVKEKDSITRIDGKTAVGVMISKQSDANTVRVSRGLHREIRNLQSAYPELTISIGADQAAFINVSIASVAKSALTGSLLAIVVVFFFLRNMRSTLVIGISIPVSLLATFAAMQLRNITLNLVTLSALTLAVGMLVDNSIVVLENIFRLRDRGLSAIEAAREGTQEIFVAIFGSTLTTVMVFLPIALTEGMASMMFGEFCFTMIIALLASLLVAVTVVPMLCSQLLQGNIITTYMRIGRRRYVYRWVSRFAESMERLVDQYDGWIRSALVARKKVLVTSLIIFVVSTVLLAFVGWELLPQTDEGIVSIDVEMPYGTLLSKKDQLMERIEQYVLTLPEVRHVSMSTAGLSAMSMTSNATLTVSLVDQKARSRGSQDVARDIRDFTSDIAGAKISVGAQSSITSMFGENDLSVMILGKDNETLETIGHQLQEHLKELPDLDRVELDITEGNPELKVKINRNAAAHYGITAYSLADGLSSALSGTRATNLTVDGRDIEVRLSLKDHYAHSIENMKQILITGSHGIPVAVGQIATFEYDNAPSVIGRHNQQNYVTIHAEVIGRDFQSAAQSVNRIVERYAFPDGYHYEMSGLSQEMFSAFESLAKALIVSVALVFLLLAAQFESPLMALIVMASVPFAMSGAFLAMFIMGSALSMTSFLGLIMLVGIVVNNSILLVEFIRQNEEELGKVEALVQAGKLRMRPILMTTATTCFGMIPLSLGIGEGGEMLAPMGISIIGGLVASTLITLILIPTIYSAIDERKQRRAAKREERQRAIRELEQAWAEEDKRTSAAEEG